MPAIVAERINNYTTSGGNSDFNASCKNAFTDSASSISSHGFWSKNCDDVSHNQLQKFWCELTLQARRKLLRIDKQTLFEHARKNMYCSRCNGLLLEVFSQIVLYGKSLQQDAAGIPFNMCVSDNQNGGELSNGCQCDAPDPSVHPWGGLITAKDGTLTLLNCYVYSKSLKGLKNVFDSARAREREREMLYPDACGGGGRGWITQGIVGYGRGHGTRETCALHTARLSVETLVEFWSALGEETRHSLLRMKEDDFIDRLMYRFDSKRFCRDCRRNVIREFKELKELKRMRRETRCTSWFCVADTDFQYEVSRDSVQADWHQTFSDSFAAYHHFEWAIGTAEGKSDILPFENVGLVGKVQVNNLDLSDLDACYITLRAWKMDGRYNEFCVKAHALRGQQCVHCRLMVGDGYVTITRGESIIRFFEHAEEAEEEEDDDSMDKDGNELDGECSRPQKHAKSPELAREFLLDAATVIFKEQVEKAFREGTARQNAHSIFVCLALKLLEERLQIACKEIITLEKQMKLIEEEEKEKREEEERKERRRTKEKEKKLRKKERLKVMENQELLCTESNLDPVVTDALEESSSIDPVLQSSSLYHPDVNVAHCRDSVSETTDTTQYGLVSSDIQDDQILTECTDSNMVENLSEDILDGEFDNTRDWNSSFLFDRFKYSRRKSKFRKDSGDFTIKWSDRRRSAALSENENIISKNESRYHTDGYESTRSISGLDKQSRTSDAKNIRNGSKLTEKFQCINPRIGDRYNSHSCTYHHEYRSRPEMRMARSGRDPKYVTKLESSSDDISKPYYRSNKNTHMEYTREIKGQMKSKKGVGNPSNSKKVWEPLDIHKKCIQSNLDTDITLRSTTKLEGSESDHPPESCSSSSDEVIDIPVQTNEDNNGSHVSNSRAEDYQINDIGLPAAEMHQNYSKEAVVEGDELYSPTRSPLKNIVLSVSSSSNSDNCSSCLSEGDSNMYSNSQNLESTSTSDSEESTPNSGRREVTHCLENGVAASHKVVVDQTTLRGQCAGSQGPAPPPVADSLSSLLKEASPNGENGRSDINVNAQPLCALPQMHNQSISYPIFQAPTVGYYHHNPLPWPAGPTNGLVSFPHSNHYLYTNSFGYGLDGNAWLMQYGAMQHLPPAMLNHAPLPVVQPVSPVNEVSMKEPLKVSHLVGHSIQQNVDSADEHPAAAEGEAPIVSADAGQNGKPDKMDQGNNGFSLFHFGGPVALSAGLQADPPVPTSLSEGDTPLKSSVSNYPDPDNPPCCSKKDPIEEYSLFAATNNGIQFSIF